MPLYRTNGHLTGTIQAENVAAAQAYLTQDDMTKYVAPNAELEGVLEHVEWKLEGNGHDYSITAFATRELTEDELERLSSECSGQNSDGLGEGFEQQEFAEDEGEDEADCYNCNGTGVVNDDDDCPTCDGAGVFERESGRMISFDWKENKLPWTRVK